ncbi:hydantoinase B/oxoprolinase family protein [Prauserella flavalba]|uniref:Hydantoinase B/oxoprolinase domain-containing protein n=1 Tax=Prauserella flavalba TaxID=1477506 RepID=A0A318LJP3_9PSEU|nr:hydantoinase B/oxoprolinase family protein [Prauserella flavalba]PXY23905.1 hypothetical protein BA062_26850 [Prauserella flavalba]
MTNELDEIGLGIAWTRLVSVVDEAATVLKRSSFSTVVRESNDFACALLSPSGDAIAENTIGVPSFSGIMGRVTKGLIEYVGDEPFRPGDLFLTNDPWMNTGHLPDTTVLMPLFRDGRHIGFAVNAAHKTDIGGAGYVATGRDVFEEGLRLPYVRIATAGVRNPDIRAIVEANTRLPEQVWGDIEAQIAACVRTSEGVNGLLSDLDLDSLDHIGRRIQARARARMIEAMRVVPEGVVSRGEVTADGYGDDPVRIVATIERVGDALRIDLTESSPQSPIGINSTYGYCFAFACYAVKCAVDPETPKNEGSYTPIEVVTRPGTIVDATFPAAVNARSMSGHLVAAAVMNALAGVVPDLVIAEAGSCPGLRATVSGTSAEGEPYVQMLFHNGGMGATAREDGLPTTGFPTNAGGTSTETIEANAPVLYHVRELLPDSGGAGARRGGLGQQVELEVLDENGVELRTQFDRVAHPAQGLLGGAPGAQSRLRLNGTDEIPAKGRMRLVKGDRVSLTFAGGGGFGSPSDRDPADIARDVELGYVTPASAAKDYGFETAAAGQEN